MLQTVQTGSPDGDLGSNEILLSNENIFAVIDDRSVFSEPASLDRKELKRLAKLRVPMGNFSHVELSKDGYRVLVEVKGIKLPSREIGSDDTDFRNGAYFHYEAEHFVPYDGRPETVNTFNVAGLLDAKGKPHFKYMVEGDSLLFTQQLRLFPKKRKVIIFNDSSANQDGVTSSSL